MALRDSAPPREPFCFSGVGITCAGAQITTVDVPRERTHHYAVIFRRVQRGRHEMSIQYRLRGGIRTLHSCRILPETAC